MERKSAYLILCVLGLLLSYSQFIPWVAANGLNLPLFFQQLFANRIGAFFGMDVFVSAAVFLAFVFLENLRAPIPGRWWLLVATLTVGVSLGLPLFLYLREQKLEAQVQKSVTTF
jgi:hypothetical protein